jgi:hypothetical protein
MNVAYYKNKLQDLKATAEINRLKSEIAKLEGDPLHPKSEGWEWDGDLGIWEQPNPPVEHTDI